MSGRDDERPLADAVADGAVDGETAGRVVGDKTLVLLVFGVAEERGALDLLPDDGGAVADSRGEEGSALAEGGRVSAWGHAGEGGEHVPVPAHDHLGRRAFGVGQFEEGLALGDGGGGGAVGEEVVEEGGLVGATHALDPDVVGAVVSFQRVGKGRAEGSLSMV